MLALMPKRKVIFVNNYFYHIYNRGVEKRTIFEDKQDYQVFIDILRYYLIPNQEIPEFFSRKPKVKISHAVDLLAYCLMPNHFHLLVKQKEDNGISDLMHALGITYSMYFNKKYQRVGSLFQGRFKAKMVDKENYLLFLSKYIHLNPQELYSKSLKDYPYSSYSAYLTGKQKDFIKNDLILNYFSSNKQKTNSYQEFVEDLETDFASFKPLLFDM
jgi:putative transposase